MSYRPTPAQAGVVLEVVTYVPCFKIVPPGPNVHEKTATLAEESKGLPTEASGGRAIFIEDDVIKVKRGGVDLPPLKRKNLAHCGIGLNVLVLQTAWTREDMIAVREAVKKVLELTGDNLKLNHEEWWEFLYDMQDCASNYIKSSK